MDDTTLHSLIKNEASRQALLNLILAQELSVFSSLVEEVCLDLIDCGDDLVLDDQVDQAIQTARAFCEAQENLWL